MSASTAIPAPERSGLNWQAALGGAAVATAVTIMLVALGSGLGLAAVSPTTSGSNPTPAAFTALAAIWLVITQWVPSFFGGYLAGRLRPRWTGLTGEETTFRATATGFVARAVASIVVVSVASAGGSALIGGTGRTIGASTSSTASGGAPAGPGAYALDRLFRPARPGAPVANDGGRTEAEAARILAGAPTGPLAPDDRTCLTGLVADRTGIAADEVERRVDNALAAEHATVARAVQLANAARKAAAWFPVDTFFSMLVGAFIACVAAAIGGRQRDL